MNHGSYTWNITNKQAIYKVIHASVGESFESDVFEIAQLQWTMILYPNGWNKKNKGCFNVCIKLLTMSSKWRQLILCRSIQCAETLSSCTSVASYYKNGDTMCWKERTLLLSELFQMNPPITALNFKVSLHILKIISKKSKQILYPTLSDATTPINFEYKPQQYIIWKIDNDTLNKFRSAYHSKSFESKKYHNKMWCLRCYPQGISSHDEGYVGLYLTLCHLPPNISKMKVLYTFRCKEFKNVKHSRIKNFSYSDKSSWGVSRFFDALKLHKMRQLTIYVDITVMNEYDESGKEVMKKMILPLNKFKSPCVTPKSPHIKSNINIVSHETEEEKVNTLEVDSVGAVFCSLSKSSTLDNTYKRYSSGNLSRPRKASQYEMVNKMKKEVKKEIEQLQMAYNIKLNSLCAIVEQIQINNDTLSSQTRTMMKTVNDVCDLMQKERSQLKTNTQRNDIARLTQELQDIKGFLLHEPGNVMATNTRITHETNSPYFEDEMKEEYDTEENEVREWLTQKVKMPCYIGNFIGNGFDDLSVIKEMTMDELHVIGVQKLGHRMKIFQHIRQLWKRHEIEHYKPPSITDSSTSWSRHKLSVQKKCNARSNSLESTMKLQPGSGARSFKRNLSVSGVQRAERPKTMTDSISNGLYTNAVFIESPSAKLSAHT